MKLLRVLHVIPSISTRHGGPSIAVRLFARAAQGYDVKVTVATTDDDGPNARLSVPVNELVWAPCEAHYIYFRRNTEAYKTSWGFVQWMRNNIAQYDLLHIHALFSFVSVAAARVARKRGIPYLIRPLGVLNRWGMKNRRHLLKRCSLRWVELPILRDAAAIHYTSEAERAEAAEAHPAIGSLPSVIVPIPVEPATAGGKRSADVFYSRFPQAAERRIVLFLSRLDPKKGTELLISAFAEIYRDFPDALLVIAGNGDDLYVKALHRKASESHCQDAILWTGFVVGDEKQALLAAASLFVLPSFSENFGIAAAEALAAGIPSILSEHVAMAREAAEAGAAILVQCEVGSIAEAMRRSLADPELRERLSRNALSFVAERYSFEAVGKQLRSVYERVIRRLPIA